MPSVPLIRSILTTVPASGCGASKGEAQASSHNDLRDFHGGLPDFYTCRIKPYVTGLVPGTELHCLAKKKL